MKHPILSSTLSLTAALLATASVAQTSLKGEVVNSPYNWTGYYLGVNMGVVNHTMNITDTNGSTFLATIEQVTNPRFTGGLQIGYRHQLDLTNASGLYGIELSANFSNATFSRQYGSPFTLYQLNSKHALDTICLLQLIGGIAADRTLLFLAAGASWSNISGSTNSVNGVPFFNSFSVTKKVWGTAVGAGAEYAFTDTLSARAKLDVITPNTYSVYNNIGNNYLIANSIVQGTLGVNYRFA